jgi:predicted MPP superfamily phosphohydrolase
MHTSEKIALLTFFLVVGAIYFLEGALLIRFIASRIRGRSKPNILLKKPVIVLHLVALAGIGCLLYGLLIEPNRIEVTTIPIRTDKLQSTSFRIVHISDLHCDNKVRNEKRMVDLIKQLGPDVIVFTGDAMNTASAPPLFKSTMKNLRASLGKFAVKGNFEIYRWKKLDLYGDTDFELLDAKTVTVSKNGETIHISGLSCDHPAGFKRLIEPVPEGDFSVFLYHFSDLIESIDDLNVDLYLSGHTHGGQVALPFYGAIITLSKLGKKYESGMYTVGDTILYVNRGIGFEPRPAPPIRFCARPEITVFDIGPRKENREADE